jgi:hypothetical protein
MTTADAGFARVSAPFRPFHKWDRNFFLLMVVLIWAGVASGFGLDTLRHFRSGEPPYPLIIHFHAVAYVGWLVLLAAQVLLIRNARQDVHRKLGLAMTGLAVFMVVIGVAATLIVEAARFGTPRSDPPFLAIPLVSVFSFAVLAAAAIALRKDSPAHKRLILLATLSISSAGFARLLRPAVFAAMGHTNTAFFLAIFLGPDVLILAMAGYDLYTRRKLHPAFIAGTAWIAMAQTLTAGLYLSPWWHAMALRLIGH